MSTSRVALVFLICLLAASSAAAQDPGRTLHWRALDVVARLDADGRLRVRERHAMVFNGAWNGGSRTFNIRRGQRHEFYSIARIDAVGNAHRLTAGDVDRVDHFAWVGANELRWRSRLPSDPPFVNQEIVYEIDYALVNILIPTITGYTLDHDFAFPDRPGTIESFTLQLEADPVWQSTTSLPLHLQRTNIPPGSSAVVTAPLRYTGAGKPSAVQHGVPLSQRLMLALILLGAFAWLLRAFLAEEIARGRFKPLEPVHEIDAAWLRAHVFSLPPEVVGAAWDTRTAAPEVAAMIARMVQEGKLASGVERHKRKQILRLELKVARDALSFEERKLVEKLFRNGETETDTEKIRKRYRESGFDPAHVIRPGIQKQIRKLPGDRKEPRSVLVVVVVVLIVVVAAMTGVLSTTQSPLLTAFIIVLAAGVAAFVPAARYRASVVDLKRQASRVVLLLLIAGAPVMAAVLGVFEAGGVFHIAPLLAGEHPGVPLLANLMVLFLGIAFLVLRAARTREAPERLARRRTLAAARAYFERELQKEQPALDDEWFPYLMAFGLGSHIDKWFRAFGPAQETAVFATSAASSSARWSGGGPLFGDGGGFGGGGAGRSWASVAQTFSSGVTAASSSGSGSGGGGGGGGGGSSGGGGGGGW